MLEAISRDRVAVFDDDIQFIRLVERVLKGVNIDIEPVTTPDVEEAARVVSCGGCRAALIDLYMYGDASGLQMVEELRQNPQTRGTAADRNERRTPRAWAAGGLPARTSLQRPAEAIQHR